MASAVTAHNGTHILTSRVGKLLGNSALDKG